MHQQDVELAARLTQDGTLAQELTGQVEEIKAKLLDLQHARDARASEKQKLSRSIKRQCEELSKTQTDFEKRAKDAKESLDQLSSHMAQLATELQQTNEEILSAKSKQVPVIPQLADTQHQPLVESHALGPSALPSLSEAEPQRRPSDILGNNALCYQGIQRAFRNSVVTFLRDRLARLFPEDHV
jgi:seryl-tRNA synthetase